MLGLAVGDALGTTLEFKPSGTFEPIETIVGGGPFRLKPGEWTDDTSMALCLVESLVECQEFDPADQMQRYVRWWRDGHLSSNGRCFDIGITVSEALSKFEKTRDAYSGSTDPRKAGNGSLMRLAPVPLFFADDPRAAIEHSAASSRTTHGAAEAVDACRYYAGLIVGAIEGRTKEELLSPMFSPVQGLWEKEPLSPAIEEIAQSNFRTENPPVISGSGGYVVPSLQIALWAFHHSDNFRDGALMAVNIGHDADTYGAIYGQLAGAYYGEFSIPSEWVASLAKRELLETFAAQLLESAL
jgi:ADP-ribosylglycohydrolase